MNYPSGRMSPITALFMGIFGCGAIAIAGATVIVLRGMSLAESQVGEIIGFAGGLVDGLPELLSSLPPALPTSSMIVERRSIPATSRWRSGLSPMKSPAASARRDGQEHGQRGRVDAGDPRSGPGRDSRSDPRLDGSGGHAVGDRR